jgi:hypothetical protein
MGLSSLHHVHPSGRDRSIAARAAGWVRVKNLPARGSWAESSVNLRARRDPVGNGGVPRVLWHIARPQKINDQTC